MPTRRGRVRKELFLPLLLSLVYLVGGVLLFQYGPEQFENDNPGRLFFFLAAAYSGFGIGYIRGIGRRPAGCRRRFEPRRLLIVSLWVTAVWLLVAVIMTRGGTLAEASSWFDDPVSRYNVIYADQAHVQLSYLEMAFAPFLIIGSTAGVFLWRELRPGHRLMVWIFPVWMCAQAVGSAVRGPIIAALLPMACAAFASSLRRQRTVSLLRITGLVSLSMTGIALFFVYFSYLVSVRTFSPGLTPEMYERTRMRQDSLLYEWTPPGMRAFVGEATYYAVHSYARLSRAMDLPFVGLGFGLANSPFITRNVERITGWSGLSEISYGERLDETEGIAPGNQWQTVFPWLASDVTFPGTLGLMVWLGYLLARSWRDSIDEGNPLAVVAFACLAFVVYKIPMNNPFGAGSGITTYLGVPLAWWMLRRKARTLWSTARAGAGFQARNGEGRLVGRKVQPFTV